ncbi:MAG: toxin-antitoxin system YwqK family antitoxin [Reichenbachiella sp.]|uniref:toxin-antitoxin system YwqK family antitoxin n=1 Tax=Reichenbachiella sp. TaxID=2184521 RepID=UPI00329A782C
MKSSLITFAFLISLICCDSFTWLPNQNTVQVGEPIKKKDGLVITKRKDGSLYSEVHYQNGVKHGLSKSYYKDGNLQFEIEYENGKKNGASKLHYANGKVRRKTTYKNGIKNGPKISYFENGNISSSITYKEDLPSSDLKEYLKSGKELSSYPELKYKVVDRLNTTGEYLVKFYFTKDNKRADFYMGELVEGKYFNEYSLSKLPEYKYEGVLSWKPYIGEFIMKKIPIVGRVKTKRGNYLYRKLTFNLAIEG